MGELERAGGPALAVAVTDRREGFVWVSVVGACEVLGEVGERGADDVEAVEGWMSVVVLGHWGCLRGFRVT